MAHYHTFAHASTLVGRSAKFINMPRTDLIKEESPVNDNLSLNLWQNNYYLYFHNDLSKEVTMAVAIVIKFCIFSLHLSFHKSSQKIRENFRKMRALSVLAFIVFPIIAVSFHEVKAVKHGTTEAPSAFSQILTPLHGVLKKLEVGDAQNSSMLPNLRRSAGTETALTSPSSWMPFILKTMKKSLNYLGNSKQFGVGDHYHGGDNGLTSVVCLLALVAIASFLLFLFQPMFLHPRRRRMSRRLRGNPSPFSYKSPTYWSQPEGKHLSSDSRPIIVPGPIVPVAVQVPLSLPRVPDTDDEHDDHEYSAHKQSKSKTRSKKKGSSSGKSYSGVSELESSINDYASPSEYNEDKLTKEEIMYILKSLND